MKMSLRQSLQYAVLIYLAAFLLFCLRVQAAEPTTAPATAEHTQPAHHDSATKKATHKKAKKANQSHKAKTTKSANVKGAKAVTAAPIKKARKRVHEMYAVIDVTHDNKDLGKIKIQLFFKRAPKTVDNFVGLAEGTKEFTDPKTGKKVKRHFYDGLTFHRIVPEFVIQGGDPLGNGRGGPGYKFNDEIRQELVFDRVGMVAMANAGPNTNGSQFFITLKPETFLNGKYSIFGEVVDGMDVVHAIAEVPTDHRTDRPLTPVIMKKVTIIRN